MDSSKLDKEIQKKKRSSLTPLPKNKINPIKLNPIKRRIQSKKGANNFDNKLIN